MSLFVHSCLAATALALLACAPRDVIPTSPLHPANPEAPIAGAAPTADSIAAQEKAAYEKAKPVFERNCARCHSKTGAKATEKKLDHFSIDSYPFGGHHAATAGKSVREALGVE